MASPQVSNQGTLGPEPLAGHAALDLPDWSCYRGGNTAIFTAICTSPSVKKFLGSVMETEPMTEDTSNNVW